MVFGPMVFAAVVYALKVPAHTPLDGTFQYSACILPDSIQAPIR